LRLQTAAQKLQKGYPNWNASVVNSGAVTSLRRLLRCRQDAGANTKRAGAGHPARAFRSGAEPWSGSTTQASGAARLGRPGAHPAEPSASPGADKASLESEAQRGPFGAARSSDPRELGRAEEKIGR